LLKVEGLTKQFGGIVALSDYSISINRGEIIGLIGPNGAGKTTVFNILSGVIKPTKGRIFFENREITRLRSDRKAALGISRTFQNIRLFNDLSVIDNIKVAYHMRLGTGFMKTLIHSPGYLASEKKIDQSAFDTLDLLDLTLFKNELAGNLPYGIQRRVEIARAMATFPKLMLLDEPVAGLNIRETEELVKIIHRIHADYDLTIFLVEHDMKMVMTTCQRIQVIDQGKMLTLGTPANIRTDKRVIEAYLGKSGELKHAVN
jgi:branched-chain amino acid transport system ATP-binding protein